MENSASPIEMGGVIEPTNIKGNYSSPQRHLCLSKG